jgi:MFS family permease
MINSESSVENNNLRRKNFYACLIMALLYGTGQTMFNVVYQPFILEFTGRSLFMTGGLITIGSVLQFLPIPWVGKLSDRFGRKAIWLFYIPLFFLGLSLFIFSNNLIFLILGVISYSFGSLIANNIFLIFISENSVKTKKGLNFGLVYFFFFGGNIIGSYLVLINVGLNFRVYFLIFIYITVINSIILIIFIADPIPIKLNYKLNRTKTAKSKKGFWWTLLKTRKTRSIIIFFTLDAFIFSISWAIYYAGMVKQYNITAQDIALLFLFLNITTMAFQIPAGHLTDKMGKKKILIISELFGLACFVIIIMAFFFWSSGFTITLIPLLIIVEIVSALGNSTFVPSESLILTDLDENKRAESYGIVGLIRGIGVIPTGFIAGILIEGVHYISPFAFTLIGIVFLLWFLIRYFERDDKNEED